jgi:hypothetical protein
LAFRVLVPVSTGSFFFLLASTRFSTFAVATRSSAMLSTELANLTTFEIRNLMDEIL